MADEVMDVMKQEGVAVLLKSSVLEVKEAGPEKEVRIKQGEGS